MKSADIPQPTASKQLVYICHCSTLCPSSDFILSSQVLFLCLSVLPGTFSWSSLKHPFSTPQLSQSLGLFLAHTVTHPTLLQSYNMNLGMTLAQYNETYSHRDLIREQSLQPAARPRLPSSPGVKRAGSYPAYSTTYSNCLHQNVLTLIPFQVFPTKTSASRH